MPNFFCPVVYKASVERVLFYSFWIQLPARLLFDFLWQTFHDRKHLDEEALYGKTEVDLSSPSELAEALQSRAFGTSRMVSLVNILQDLLAIEMLEKEHK